VSADAVREKALLELSFFPRGDRGSSQNLFRSILFNSFMSFYSSARDPKRPTREAVIDDCIAWIRERDPDFKPQATVVANAPLSIAAKAVAHKLADALYRLEWLRLSEDGAWMLRVFDHSGACVEISSADDPQDALLAVADRLLP
jgi:hypothetical protein